VEVELPPIDPRELETAQWWLVASKAWTAFKARRLSFADAVREELAKYPCLLSVPIQESAGYEGGQLANGYALLLEHVEMQERGFVRTALTRLEPQFTTSRAAKAYPLGRQVYDYLVAEGRLYKTYPDFVKNVLVSALPHPGVWTQARISESDGETRVFTRPSPTIGEPEEQSQSSSEDKQRFVERLFSTSLAPLTARIFHVEAGNLNEPRVVEVRLMENGAPSDKAWLLIMLPDGKIGGGAPRRLKVEGTTLTELLGKDYNSLWIAVFNPDPNAEKGYDLTLSLKKKASPSAKPTQAGAPRSSPFARKGRVP